jgi:uncharacterized RDD family membrane protein YckC
VAGEGAAAQGGIEYVGFWRRLLAALLDLFVLLVLIVPVELAVFGTDYLRLATAGKTLWVDIWVQFVIPVVALILLWRYRSATPGLMAISARIVDAGTLAPATAGKLVVRAIALALLLLLIPFLVGLVGLLWTAFDRRKQGLHDKIAGTVVIRR